jgi:hypothetical protein
MSEVLVKKTDTESSSGIRYKLTMVNQCDRQVALVGYFGSESALEKWAKENQGELAKV